MPPLSVRLHASLSAWGLLLAGLFAWVPFLPRLLRSVVTGPGDRARTLALIRAALDVRPAEAPERGANATPARVLLVAGEPSGDLHGAALASALRRALPGVRLEGLGGPRMAAAGVDLLEDLVSTPVMGIWPVVRRLPYFFRVYRSLLVRLGADPPDVVVGIDYPGFNLRLGRSARARGVPFVQYIAPQVWAWAPWRARTLARATERVLAILPFEAPILRRAGADVAYVGHPLFERGALGERDPATRAAIRDGAGADGLLAILPGSRRREVADNLPLQLAVAERVLAARPGLRFVLPLAAERLRGEVEQALAAHPTVASRLRLEPPERAEDAMAAADCALSVSGTATLHLVAHGVPAVVLYRVSLAGRLLSRALLVAPFIALPNLLAGERLLPEFLARDAEDESIAVEVEALLPGGERREETLVAIGGLRDRLRVEGVPDRVAGWVLSHARPSAAPRPAP